MQNLDACPQSVGIYAIRCSENAKVYVGSSKNIKQRLLAHWNALYGRYHDNTEMQKDYEQFGDDAFEWRVLALTDEGKEQANIEWEWIQRFDACNPKFGYNRTEWAVGVKGATLD